MPEVEQVQRRNHGALPVVVDHHVEILFAVALGVEAADQDDRNFPFADLIGESERIVAAEHDPGAVAIGGDFDRSRSAGFLLEEAEPVTRPAHLQLQLPENKEPVAADFRVRENRVDAGGRIDLRPRSRQGVGDESPAARAAAEKSLLRQRVEPAFDGDRADAEQFLKFARTRQLLSRRKPSGEDQLPELVGQQLIERLVLRGIKFELIPGHINLRYAPRKNRCRFREFH
ncbi:hypothetical protein SDC9_160276 [bioreactor metagenome]|uniref:Uncharacterized protein n=1 Tax=bioreactor metagenome TaxID=1076179 RepID=A0A645FH41_9ZZZZ